MNLNESQKHELMSVVWINVVIDIPGEDESEAEEIMDLVNLLQQEWRAAAADSQSGLHWCNWGVIWMDGIKARAASLWL